MRERITPACEQEIQKNAMNTFKSKFPLYLHYSKQKNVQFFTFQIWQENYGFKKLIVSPNYTTVLTATV